MKKTLLPRLAFAALFAFAGSFPVQASMRADIDDVEIQVVDDRGRTFRQHPVSSGGRTTRTYVEAIRGKNYAVRLSNRSGDRIGLVIAVDGRNIISGKQSHLHPTERKYIIGPYQTAEYEGWRTSKNRVNRFYFTDAADSYAEAFDDSSAMGVIAIAVYREKVHEPAPSEYDFLDGARRGKRSLPGGLNKSGPEPGTGFGESEWSPSRQVRFEPEPKPIAKHFLKYEWRKTLCRKGVVSCHQHAPRNRFWPEEDDDGFAPYPPDETYTGLWGSRHRW